MEKKSIWQKVKGVFTFRRLNISILLVLIGIIVVALFAPIVPAKYEKPDVINKDNLIAGSTLNYKMKSCRYVGEAVVTTVTRKLVSIDDPELTPITLSQDTITNPARCLEPRRTLILPLSTPPGKYQLVVTGVYEVIPLRQPIAVQSKSDAIEIKKSLTNLDIEFLLEENARLKAEAENNNSPARTNTSSGSSSSSSTRTQTTSPTTVNNTTNNNTTNNNPVVEGEESADAPQGLIPSILNFVLGGR